MHRLSASPSRGAEPCRIRLKRLPKFPTWDVFLQKSSASQSIAAAHIDHEMANTMLR